MVTLTIGMLRTLLTETHIPIRVPRTPAQKEAMIDLVNWAASRMGVYKPTLSNAIKKATRENDWEEALDLLSTYYMMKGIKSKRG